MFIFSIILISIMSLVVDSSENKPRKRELVTTLFRKTPLPIWRRTPPPIFPNRYENKLTEIPIWRRTPVPIFPNRNKNNSVELPIWHRTPPPVFPNRSVNNLSLFQQGYKSANKTDGVSSLFFKKWFVKDIYHLKKSDIAREIEIKNMGRWILRWDLWDNKFKFGKHNRTDYIMYSRWRFLYEPPISNIIDFFKNF
ncbi:unnamed protein product [Meloidogyne enterolobii]|uniref:Uncharacterized protein n=1 Tax=Meloidogyne enterolobii TaxID=390850 RepID=A0ACB1ABK9_MELEN